jgi:hypothetical protein
VTSANRFRAPVLFTVFALLMSLAPAASAATPPPKPSADKAIFFGSDGMRPDLMESYAAQGLMPTYADLMAKGVRGANGMVQAFPPNTGVGWYTLATGTYPGEHGSTNNTIRTGTPSAGPASPPPGPSRRIDRRRGRRAGKRRVDRVGGAAAGITARPSTSPTFPTRGVWRRRQPSEQAGLPPSGSVPDGGVCRGSGWSNVPASDPAARRANALTVSRPAPNRLVYDIYL